MCVSACGDADRISADEPEEAPVSDGSSEDLCDRFGWYGDGSCDDFCAQIDPDCVEQEEEDEDEDEGDDEEELPSCDDGSVLACRALEPTCAAGEVAAVINSCWSCVDAATCQPSTTETEGCQDDADCPNGYCEITPACDGPDCPPVAPSECVVPNCDDGSENFCNALEPTCATGETAAQQDGCWVCVDARTCQAPSMPRLCGGPGDSCDAGEYCRYEIEDMCGAADQQGVCTPIPQACPFIDTPEETVCGCDGVTYLDACDASTAGVSVAHLGACEAPAEETCGGFAGDTCAFGYYCNYDDDDACGAADGLGFCEPSPDACDQAYEPVCGCDGSTYGNACMARASGVDVAFDGICDP